MLDDWYGRAGDVDRLTEIAVSCTTRPIPRAALDAFGRDAARVTRTVLEQSLGLCCTSDFRSRVAGSTVPTLVVGGHGDWIFTPDALREGVVAPLACAEMQTLDCGHEIPLEAPQELADLVSGFVRDSRRSP